MSKGRVVFYNVKRKWGILTGGQVSYFMLGDDCRITGGHLCLLVPGVEVTFEAISDPAHERDRAVNVQLVQPVEVPDREEATITSLRHMNAYAQRSCGCEIYVYLKEIRSQMPRALRIGDHIIFTPTDTNHGLWDAMDCDVVIPQEELKQEEAC